MGEEGGRQHVRVTRRNRCIVGSEVVLVKSRGRERKVYMITQGLIRLDENRSVSHTHTHTQTHTHTHTHTHTP